MCYTIFYKLRKRKVVTELWNGNNFTQNDNIEFFKWLFEKDKIKMEKTIDLTLCRNYDDPNIYYPKELGDFFRTSPMVRISRILQLALHINDNSNVYHTRFEHCLGVYNKKKNILIRLCKNPDFKEFVEKNGLKNHLIAELIKSAGHDIGHLPLSHVLELWVIKKVGFHEVIGKRILLENKEIRTCLDAISPNLHSALEDVLSSDVFGFESIDEGNYDIDRFDYVLRDSFYRGKNIALEFENFNLCNIALDRDLNPIINDDGSLQTATSKSASKTVPVFDISSYEDIVALLKYRFQAYMSCYSNPLNEIRDRSVAILLNSLMTKENFGSNKLNEFLKILKTNIDPNSVDLNEFLKWDDLKFYNEILSIAINSEKSNSAISDLATFSMPRLKSLMNMTFCMLDMKNSHFKDLSQEDKDFIVRIRRLIKSNSKIANAIKSPNLIGETIQYTTDKDLIERLKEKQVLEPGIEIWTSSVIAYNKKHPIYVSDETGKIFPIDDLPTKDFDLPVTPQNTEFAFILLPLIRELPPEKQSEILSYFSGKTSSFKMEHYSDVNLSPVKVGNNIEEYFL